MLSRRQLIGQASLYAPLVTASASGFFSRSVFAEDSDDVGVASGEPTPDSVILWTRIPSAFQSAGQQTVTAIIATSPNFEAQTIVSQQQTVTGPDRDFTVTIKVEDLNPATFYYYKFKAESGYESVSGRTKTAPAGDADVAVKVAVVSCQNFSQGYFLAYQAICAGDYDFVLHLGDFIYEKGATNAVRPDNIGGGEAKTLADYRGKYKLYLTDPHLREARRMFPFVHLWDDHEVFNNYAGPSLTGDDISRQFAGYKAFFEYNPLPGPIDLQTDRARATMNRTLRFGKHLDLFALDQRQFRDPVVCGRDMIVKRCNEALDEGRTMLGADQMKWTLDQCANSSASWKLIASELMMIPVRTPYVPFLNDLDGPAEFAENTFLTLDSWDGYPAERRRLVAALAERQVKDLLVCSGDIHNFFAGTLHLDPDDANSPGFGAELTTASISSKGITDYLGGALTAIVKPGIVSRNPHIQFLDLKYHGHIELNIDEAGVKARMISWSDVQTPQGQVSVLKSFALGRGQTKFVVS